MAKKKHSRSAGNTEDKLEEGLTLILTALPKLLIRWMKKK